MEELNSFIQFFFILKILTKSSNGLRTCLVYDRETIAKEICLKDKRRRLLLQRENQSSKSSSRWNTYMKIPRLPPDSNQTINGVRYIG